MNAKISFGLVALGCLLGPQTAARAGFMIASFRDGTPTPIVGGSYAGTEDTMLVRNGSGGGQVDQNFGGRSNMEVGTVQFLSFGGALQRNSLLRFDLTALQGAYTSIDSAVLRLHITSNGALGNGEDLRGNGTLQLFRLSDANRGWVEGTGVGAGGGDPPDTGTSTWESRIQGSQNWAGGPGAAGSADIVGPLLGSATFTVAGTPAGSVLDLAFTHLSFLDDWIAGNNAGMTLRVQGADERFLVNALSLATRENPNLLIRPELRITYTAAAVPEPSSLTMAALPALLGVGMMLVRSRRRGTRH